MDKPLVIYHGNCYDGFTAAWIARRAHPSVELYAAAYGGPPPDVTGRVVYVLDFSYPREVMERMYRDVQTMLVLDHHKTAEADCAGLEFCRFDMERSGCRMAWDFFFSDEDCPEWIKRVEDRDLWRFTYPDTKDVHAYIAALSMTMENWDNLHGTELREVARSGSAIRRYIETYIEKAAQEARLVCFEADCVVVLNIPYQNASETASYLLERCPAADYSMAYFQRADGRWQYSLRSRPEFDVSEVAKRHGGGGHAQAAGFETARLIVPSGGKQ